MLRDAYIATRVGPRVTVVCFVHELFHMSGKLYSSADNMQSQTHAACKSCSCFTRQKFGISFLSICKLPGNECTFQGSGIEIQLNFINFCTFSQFGENKILFIIDVISIRDNCTTVFEPHANWLCTSSIGRRIYMGSSPACGSDRPTAEPCTVQCRLQYSSHENPTLASLVCLEQFCLWN